MHSVKRASVRLSFWLHGKEAAQGHIVKIFSNILKSRHSVPLRFDAIPRLSVSDVITPRDVAVPHDVMVTWRNSVTWNHNVTWHSSVTISRGTLPSLRQHATGTKPPRLALWNLELLLPHRGNKVTLPFVPFYGGILVRQQTTLTTVLAAVMYWGCRIKLVTPMSGEATWWQVIR